MLQVKEFEIQFNYQGKLVTRKIDKIIFNFDDYSYTLYRIKGKKSNFDLLKSGKWWQVNIVEKLPIKLIDAIGEGIDSIEGL